MKPILYYSNLHSISHDWLSHIRTLCSLFWMYAPNPYIKSCYWSLYYIHPAPVCSNLWITTHSNICCSDIRLVSSNMCWSPIFGSTVWSSEPKISKPSTPRSYWSICLSTCSHSSKCSNSRSVSLSIYRRSFSSPLSQPLWNSLSRSKFHKEPFTNPVQIQ